MAGLSLSGVGEWCSKTVGSRNSKLNAMHGNSSIAATQPAKLFIEVGCLAAMNGDGLATLGLGLSIRTAHNACAGRTMALARHDVCATH